MTEPSDPSRDTPIDPSDPRWVEDILERARRRAEEARPAAAGTTPAPAAASAAPASVAPSPATPRTASEAPEAPAVVPARNPRPRPLAGPAPDLDADAAGNGARGNGTAGNGTGVGNGNGTAVGTADPRGRTAGVAPRAAGTIGGPAPAGEDVLREPLADGAPPDGEPPDGEPTDEPAGMDKRMRSWLEWGGVIVGALLVAFLIRAVAFQAFYIPSESMEDTLMVKDRLLVNKLSYKLHDVHRGDIIVFEKPPGETSKINDLIKRVIALPGETIEQQGNDIYIDRGQGPQKLTEGYIKDLGDIGQTITWVQGCANPSTETTKCTIPEGHVWVMGDNRGHSHDSRVFGPIDEDLIVGRAFVKVWPLNKIGFL